jgi:hypothetical protein
MNNLIREGRRTNENAGITSFGNLIFDLDGINMEKEPHDPKLLLSALERAPWLHLQESGAWSTEIFEQVVSSDNLVVEHKNEASDLMAFTPIEQETALSHFTFEDYSSDESRESSIIEVSEVDTVGADNQMDLDLYSDAPVATIGSHSDQPNDNNTLGSENNLELTTQSLTVEAITGNTTLDSRLQRVEKLLEQLVINQSHDSESNEAIRSDHTKHYSGENLSPIQETEEENNDSSGVTDEVETLRHELSELKRQFAQQASVNMQLREQIEADKKSKLLKLFGRKK